MAQVGGSTAYCSYLQRDTYQFSAFVGLEVDRSRALSATRDIEIDMTALVENARIALEREDDRGKAIVLRGFISEIRAQRVNKKIEGEIEYHLPTQGNGKKFIAAL